MSQSSATLREFDKIYEDECRERIPTILWQFLRIGVKTPTDGVNRKFQKSAHAFLAEDAEIDYWAHSVGAVSHISILNSNPIPNVMLYLPTVTIPDPVSSKNRVPNMSPEKGTDSSVVSAEGYQYILGEITNGGKRSVRAKVDQLERDCRLVLAKSGNVNILDTVAVGLIVANKDLHEIIFEQIAASASLPHVKSLYCAGRIVFVHDANTILSNFKILHSRMEETKATVDENTQKIDETKATVDANNLKIEEIKAAVEANNVKMDALAQDFAVLKNLMMQMFNRG